MLPVANSVNSALIDANLGIATALRRDLACISSGGSASGAATLLHTITITGTGTHTVTAGGVANSGVALPPFSPWNADNSNNFACNFSASSRRLDDMANSRARHAQATAGDFYLSVFITPPSTAVALSSYIALLMLEDDDVSGYAALVDFSAAISSSSSSASNGNATAPRVTDVLLYGVTPPTRSTTRTVSPPPTMLAAPAAAAAGLSAEQEDGVVGGAVGFIAFLLIAAVVYLLVQRRVERARRQRLVKAKGRKQNQLSEDDYIVVTPAVLAAGALPSADGDDTASLARDSSDSSSSGRVMRAKSLGRSIRGASEFQAVPSALDTGFVNPLAAPEVTNGRNAYLMSL